MYVIKERSQLKRGGTDSKHHTGGKHGEGDLTMDNIGFATIVSKNNKILCFLTPLLTLSVVAPWTGVAQRLG